MAAKKAAEPTSARIGVAPLTAEDPSRQVDPGLTAVAFPGYPKSFYHPVRGRFEAKDPNEEAQIKATSPAHNWFDTAEEADAHRTDREAQDVIHYNRRVRADGALTTETPETDPYVTGEAGIVRNSVSATESLKSGNAEPL